MRIAAGADVQVVQRKLGRADATMRLNTAADLRPDRPDDVMTAITKQRSRALDAPSASARLDDGSSAADGDCA